VPEPSPDYLLLIKKYWHETVGLVAANLLAVSVEISLFIIIKTPSWIDIAVLLMTVVIISLTWSISRRPPKTQKNKLGFLVSIACSDDIESQKIKEDFIIPLRQLVRSGAAGKHFHFMELPQYLAAQIIEPETAQTIRIKCRAHFMLFGRVRVREIGGRQRHIIEFEGLVSHRPIPQSVSQSFSQEFAELLPRKLSIATENDLFSFQFTSEWTDIVARYIIGIATALSGNFDDAETLLIDARDRLRSKNRSFPIYAKLIERIPIRISELNEVRAVAMHRRWVGSHTPDLLNQVGTYIDKIEPSRQNQPDVLTLRAIYIFLRHRQTEQAIALLRQSSNQNNGQWHFNMAFLLAYKEDLKGAIRHYRLGMQYDVQADTLFQIEDFIHWLIEQEPEKYQLLFCLGFFNWKIRGDRTSAIENFTDFLHRCNATRYPTERRLAQRWLEELSQSPEDMQD
jgi:hypothetical protein